MDRLDIEWDEIDGHNGRYLISNYGDIMSTQFHGKLRNKVIIPGIGRGGYYITSLWGIGGTKRTNYKYHRLVAESFVEGKTIEKCHVNHIDGNKQNNYYRNLEWTTPKLNSQHARQHGLCIAAKGSDHYTAKKVIRVCLKSLEGDIVDIYEGGVLEIATKYGYSRGYIAAMIRGLYSSILPGFIFEYIDNYKTRNHIIIQKDLYGNTITQYDSISLAITSTGLSRSTITRCINGTYKTGGGYIWEKVFIK